MPNRTEARPAKAVLTYATGRLPLLRLFSTPLIIRKKAEGKRTLVNRLFSTVDSDSREIRPPLCRASSTQADVNPAVPRQCRSSCIFRERLRAKLFPPICDYQRD